jgi:hypothetical protein
MHSAKIPRDGIISPAQQRACVAAGLDRRTGLEGRPALASIDVACRAVGSAQNPYGRRSDAASRRIRRRASIH